MTTGAVVLAAFVDGLAAGTLAGGPLVVGPPSWENVSMTTTTIASAAIATPPSTVVDRGTAFGTLVCTSRVTAYTRTGSSMPFSRRHPRGRNPTLMLACVMPFTVELTRTSPGWAAAHRRAAILTARPM